MPNLWEDIHTRTPADTQIHTSTVISQLYPLFYLFNLFISVFVFSCFTICFSLFFSIPLCLAQWRGEDRGTGGGRTRVCAGGAFEHSSSIATVLWWSREWYREIMKRRTKALSMWLIPSCAPPFFPACLSLSPALPLSSSLSFSLISPRPLPTSNGVSLSLSQPPFPLPPSLFPPCLCSFTWHSCTEMEEYLWIIRKWDSSLISDFTVHWCLWRTWSNHNWNVAHTCINRKYWSVMSLCLCVSDAAVCMCELVLCLICISTSHHVAKTTSSVHLGGQKTQRWCKHSERRTHTCRFN